MSKEIRIVEDIKDKNTGIIRRNIYSTIKGVKKVRLDEKIDSNEMNKLLKDNELRNK